MPLASANGRHDDRGRTRCHVLALRNEGGDSLPLTVSPGENTVDLARAVLLPGLARRCRGGEYLCLRHLKAVGHFGACLPWLVW